MVMCLMCFGLLCTCLIEAIPLNFSDLVHYMTNNMWLLNVIPKPWALICCCNNLHSSGFRLSTRFLKPGSRIFSLSAITPLVRSVTDVWQQHLACKRRTTASQRCWKVWGEGSLQGSQVVSCCSGKTFQIWLCVQRYSHNETGAARCLKYHCML